MLAKRPGLKLAAWIAEEGDKIHFAKELGFDFPILTVKNAKDVGRLLQGMGSFDLALVSNFGIILPEEILNIPTRGFLNLHLGLLPDYPGREPIRDVLKTKEIITGVTLHRMTKKVDAGPILAKRIMSLGVRRQPDDVFERLAYASATLIEENLPFILF
jgi:methionyl-tRNA formyltransferase